MTTDDVLARIGLQTRMGARDYIFPALGLFGAGILVGAGLGLLFAPRAGAEMRSALYRGATRLRHPFSRMSENLEELSREELYERAKDLGIEGRAEMTRQELYEALSSRGH